jgi:tetratricopeptide (TPR) repeat protein
VAGLCNYFGGYGGYYGGYYGGMGYAYDPYCDYGYDPGMAMAAAPPQDDALAANQAPEITPKNAGKDTDNSRVFAEKGETDFKARDYKGAVYAWKHAVVDDPMNGVLLMMLAQGFFATSQYNEAAGVVQQAMQVLPKEEWGVVVKNYKELYTNIQDFTDQLRALEKAVKEKPNDPALRFLAGFEYAYLGYPKEAVDQLDKGLKIAPQDHTAKKLRDEMAAKLKPAEAPTPGLK